MPWKCYGLVLYIKHIFGIPGFTLHKCVIKWIFFFISFSLTMKIFLDVKLHQA